MSSEYRFVGFLAKKVVARPDWLPVANVVEIASVSDCLSKRPVDQSECQAYNHASFYNNPETAWNGVPEDERDAYELFAYRVLLVVFGRSGLEDGYPFDPELGWMGWVPCADEPDLSGFERVGYDVTECWGRSFSRCSPLSCNLLARDYPVNACCLLDDESEARALAEPLGRGELPAEPGPYVVLEVLRSRARFSDPRFPVATG